MAYRIVGEVTFPAPVPASFELVVGEVGRLEKNEVLVEACMGGGSSSFLGGELNIVCNVYGVYGIRRVD